MKSQIHSIRRTPPFFLQLFFLSLCVPPAYSSEINNGTIRLVLDADEYGVPIIRECVWCNSQQSIFSDEGFDDGMKAWAPEALLPT
ncbi:MAG: hypothetical protein ABIH23_13495 [bacterium]